MRRRKRLEIPLTRSPLYIILVVVLVGDSVVCIAQYSAGFDSVKLEEEGSTDAEC